MITLEDLLVLSKSVIDLMNGNIIVCCIDPWVNRSYFSTDLLKSRVTKIEAIDRHIRVWLEGDK